jgi:hypothetical protein
MAGMEDGETFASIEDALETYRDPDEDELDPGESAEDGGDDAEDVGEDDGDPSGLDESAGDDKAEEADYSGGRFAPDDAMVRLEDGTVTTVAELRRGGLRQADYTKKATALADERRTLQAETMRVAALDQEHQEQRRLLAHFAGAIMPREPDPALISSDPNGYRQQLEAYKAQVGMLGRLGDDIRAFNERLAAEQAWAMGAAREEQSRRLTERAPEFGREDYYRQFWNEAVRAGEFYGYTADELEQLDDHRHYLVLRDALAYRRIKARNARSRTRTDGLPPVITGGRRRSAEQARRERKDAAWARFNRNRSLRNAVDLID